MKRFLIALSVFLLASFYSPQRLLSQDTITVVEALYENEATESQNLFNKLGSWCKEKNVATGLDIGINLGTMGIGLEVSTPITKWVNLRAGVDWMPDITLPLSFNLNTYSDGLPTGNFNNVADKLYEMTGIEMDSRVKMKGTGFMLNFKLLVDVYPFQTNRHWHFTAGFYAGSSLIGKAINYYDDKPTLVGLNIYNRAYEYFTTLESIYDVPLGGGTYMNPELVEKLRNRFEHYGRMGIRVGDFKDGSPYILEPAPDGTISAKAYVNHFKPYIGAGYSLDFGKDDRWHFGVDVGALFWGGAPTVINYDYVNNREVNFTKDLINIRGEVGDYMKIIKALPVCPLLTFKISYTIL